MKKKSRSLLRQYILIIVIAVILFPVSMPVASVGFYTLIDWLGKPSPAHYDYQVLEEKWHRVGDELEEADKGEINDALLAFQKDHPQSSVYWVDGQGETQETFHVQEPVPSNWDTGETVQFMKESYYGDPFTIVAFIGEGHENGFMVFQIPRKYIQAVVSRYHEEYGLTFVTVGMAVIYGIFLLVSLLFFIRIRKRIVHLQQAMGNRDPLSIPEPVEVGKRDEIGLLKNSFNEMIDQLKASRQKEQEEERLRRELIANLSHDLRTPLTSLRGQIYALKREVDTDKGNEAIELADEKITYLGELIDNLLSYSLLSSNKYPSQKERVEIVRITRKFIAMWYDTLEREGIQVDSSLPEERDHIYVDPNWLQRIFDNVMQNVIRHAASGQYIGIFLNKNLNTYTLSIQDHGPGLSPKLDSSKGAGIGLTIISLMAEEMNIDWKIQTNDQGTLVQFVIPYNKK